MEFGWMIGLLLAGLVAGVLLGRAWGQKSRQQWQRLAEERGRELDQKKAQAQAAREELEQLRAQVWQGLNTIHLSAGLTQEAKNLGQAQEEQNTILRECGRLLERL